MPNRRTEIRNGFMNFLKGKIPSIPSVTTGRRRTIDIEELPLINVIAGDESVVIFDVAPRRYRRELDIVIEIYVRAKDDVDDYVEGVMKQIEYHINREDRFSLYDTVDEIIHTGSSVSPEGREATQESAVATLSYSVVYFTFAGAIAGEDQLFDGINADWDGHATDIIEISHL